MGKFQTYINQDFPFEWVLKELFSSEQKLTILDIGACEGEDTIRFSKKYKNATIYTFEPLPENLDKIHKNFRKYKVDLNNLYPVALSNVSGMSSFFVSSGQPSDPAELNDAQWDHGNKSSSLFEPGKTKDIHPWLKFNRTVPVSTLKFSDVAKREYINDIDFVYMDVQGAEKLVLEGFDEYIYKTKAIWLEVENLELYKNQPLRSEIEAFMETRGFIKVMDTVNDVSGDQFYINTVIVDTAVIRAIELKQHQLNSPNGLRGNTAESGVSLHEKIANKMKSVRGKISLPNSTVKTVTIYDPAVEMLIEEQMLWAFPNGQYYERNVDYWLRRLIISTYRLPVIYDIGANYGYYSLVASKMGAQVFSFEPVDKVRSYLIKNIKRNAMQSLVAVYNYALSDKDATDKINLYSSSGNNSIAKRNIPIGHELKHLGTQQISLKTLDQLVKEHSLLPPTLIKIDVEGHELRVLRGSEQVIRRYKPDIIVEYSMATSEDSGYKRVKILDWLQKMDYQVFGLKADNQTCRLLTGKQVDSSDTDNLIAVSAKRFREIS